MRNKCNFGITLLFAAFVFSAWICPAVSAQSRQPQAEPEAKTTALALRAPPWTGDLDGLIKRRYLRALVVYSKTQYYVVKGVQHGVAYDELIAFQDFINRKYPTQQKNLRFHVVFVPVPRDQLLPRLAAGRGDIAVATLTVTLERQRLVDFSDPMATGVKEVVVTGPSSPQVNTVEDLSGQEVFVRPSSSYFEHLQELNDKLKKEGKPLVKLRAAPEDLEDEDLLEMLNAGLAHIVVTDSRINTTWTIC